MYCNVIYFCFHEHHIIFHLKITYIFQLPGIPNPFLLPISVIGGFCSLVCSIMPLGSSEWVIFRFVATKNAYTVSMSKVST